MPNAADLYPLRRPDQGERTDPARFYCIQRAALGGDRGAMPPANPLTGNPGRHGPARAGQSH
jgi:hypothetical protein